MDWNMNQLLATGGILAIIATAWTHIKTAFAYVSSFVIVRANYSNHTAKRALMEYLKHEYRLVPSGVYNYAFLLQRLKGSPIGRYVPFRALNEVNIFYRGTSVVIVKLGQSVTITALRGTIDLNLLTNKALNLLEERETCDVHAHNSRFYVRRIVGAEKGAANAMTSRNRSGGISESSADAREAPNSSGFDVAEYVNTRFDDSIRYSRDQYLYEAKDDPFGSLYLPAEVMRHVDDAQLWMDHADWYRERQIPWRRGWLVHGPGGTGKSSLARALAQKLGIPLMHFHLATLSDQELMEEWSQCDWPAVALFEDFDNVFHGRENKTEHKSLTFDCLLNLLSGVDSASGVFLFITTNHIEHIDPALGVKSDFGDISTRPGRVDAVIELRHLTEDARRRISTRILRDWPDVAQATFEEGDGMTGAQFQDLCTIRALRMIERDGLPGTR